VSNRDLIAKMQKQRRDADYYFIRIAVSIFVVVAIIALTQPYFEAKTYNKFTAGPRATYWDAVWASLRVNSQ